MSKKFTAFILLLIAIMVGPIYVSPDISMYYYGAIGTLGMFYQAAQGVTDTWGKDSKREVGS